MKSQATIEMASLVDRRWKYDVFLSFRGEDTRNGFTGHLYSSLCLKGINTFIDEEKLERGGEISPALATSIEESRFSLVVFSRNYASSTWCLNELVKILWCRQSKGQMVIPIFYDVEPSEVRKQTGNYGKALAKHEEKFQNNVEKVGMWREALCAVGSLSGWPVGNGHESKLIQSIAKDISDKLSRTHLRIAKYPIAIDSRLCEINSLMDIKDSVSVHMVGIYGFRGIGKTTIAKAVYNWKADHFEGNSFLMSIRERCQDQSGLVYLQELLLSDILGDKNLKVGNVDRGINLIKERLCSKKILLVLDDVDDLDQLDKLAGGCDWFGPGSRVVITTRDKNLLTRHQVVSTYQVKSLSRPESMELFCRHAFNEDKLKLDYMELVNTAVHVTKGIPLAIVKLGSCLLSRSSKVWKDTLDEYDSDSDSDFDFDSELDSHSVQLMLETTDEVCIKLNSDSVELFLDPIELVSDSIEVMLEKTDELCTELVSDSVELVSEPIELVSDSVELMLNTTEEICTELVADTDELVSEPIELVSNSFELMLKTILETDSDSDSD